MLVVRGDAPGYEKGRSLDRPLLVFADISLRRSWAARQGYSCCPMNISRNWNMFRKEMYRLRAPSKAALFSHS